MKKRPLVDPAERDELLSERAYRELHEQILRGAISHWSSEYDLAERLGMSKTPVREALHRLASDGIVVTSPRHGWEVRVPKLREIRDMFGVRNVLEGLAVTEAVAHANLEDLEKLAELSDRSFVYGDLQSYRRFGWDNYLFHTSVAKASHNSTLETHLRLLLSHIQLGLESDYIGADPVRMENEHRELVEHLRNRDAVGARALVNRHIQSTLDRLIGPAEAIPLAVKSDRAR
ncbi:MAG: GntR family transcriptional regulator [Chloroflexi bacterium]|nr:GntR family transcriptional regulator [Chloroflexota bacterium]